MNKVIEQHECPKHGMTDHTCFSGLNRTIRNCQLCTAENVAATKKREEEQRQQVAARLAEDERKRKQAEIEACMRTSNVPERFKACTLDNYLTESKSQQESLQACQAFVDRFDEFKDRGLSMFMLGNYGNGKTHLACAIVNALARQGYTAQIHTVAKIIRAIRDTWRRTSDKSEQWVIDYLVGLDLLVMDEAGLQYGSDAERISLSEVINGRYENMRPTIIISNLSQDELGQVLGHRIMDRMVQNGSVIGFNWDSYRGKA